MDNDDSGRPVNNIDEFLGNQSESVYLDKIDAEDKLISYLSIGLFVCLLGMVVLWIV